MNESVFDLIISDVLWMLAGVGLLLALGAGLLLVFAPGRALRLGDFLRREWSVAWLQQVLDRPRGTEPWIYRHHRLIGSLLVLATIFFFWTFATTFSTDAVVELYSGLIPTVVLEILATTLTWILVIGNALGFALGVIMLIRPSLLKGTEASANRWVDTHRAAEALDRSIDRPEGVAQRYPRRVGAVILIATLYIIAIAWFSLT